MAQQFAVLHIEKGKGSGGGLGNHIDRQKGKEHTFPHSDPMRKNLNREFVGDKYRNISVPLAVKMRIEEGYTKPNAIRRDAVRYLSTVLTGSHEQMTEISKDKNLLNKWIKANFEFAKDEFGKENIIRFTLHLDEKTPHIHLVHVPITNEGGLSARQYIGNRTKLRQIQNRYAEAMKPFKLERGIKNTGITHDTAKQYYRRIKIVESEVEKLEVKGIFGVKKDETIDLLQNTLRNQILTSELENKKKYQELNQVQRDLKYVEQKLEDSKKTLQKINQVLDFVLKSPENAKKYKNYLAKEKAKIEQEKTRKKGLNRGRGI